MMDFKKQVIITLDEFGRLSTSRIAAILGVNINYIKPVLEELLREKKLTKTQETLATYWSIQKLKGGNRNEERRFE